MRSCSIRIRNATFWAIEGWSIRLSNNEGGRTHDTSGRRSGRQRRYVRPTKSQAPRLRRRRQGSHSNLPHRGLGRTWIRHLRMQARRGVGRGGRWPAARSHRPRFVGRRARSRRNVENARGPDLRRQDTAARSSGLPGYGGHPGTRRKPRNCDVAQARYAVRRRRPAQQCRHAPSRRKCAGPSDPCRRSHELRLARIVVSAGDRRAHACGQARRSADPHPASDLGCRSGRVFHTGQWRPAFPRAVRVRHRPGDR